MTEYRIQVEEMAVSDMTAIWHWLAKETGTEFADTYLDELEAYFRKLVSFPHRGRLREDLHVGARSLLFESRYLIVYLVEKDRVRILRVLDGKRKLDDLSYV